MNAHTVITTDPANWHHSVAARSDRAGDYHRLVTQHALAGKLSALFGTDDLNELADNAAHDLRADHSYDIIECCDPDRNGDPVRQRRSGE